MGAVHCQGPLLVTNRQQARNQARNHRLIDGKTAEESLQALEVRIHFRTPEQRRGELRQVHRLDLEQCQEKLSQESQPGAGANPFCGKTL
jgi:hypothetical protein